MVLKGRAVTALDHENLRDLPIEFYQQEERKIFDYNGIPHSFVSIPYIRENGEIVDLQYTESLSSTHHHLQILKIVLIAVTLLAAIPVFLSSRVLGNFISRPISSMIETMSEIRRSGQYKSIDLPEESKDELYQMGETFNKMIHQLELNYEKQEQFVSNASHELKTPLTVIESYSSLLKRRGKDRPDIFDESVEAIQSEASRMKELTEQLLILARHDEQWNVKEETFSLKTIMEQSIRSFQTAFHRDIESHIQDDVMVVSDQQKLKQLLYIFLDNAYKYSDHSITVKMKAKDDKAMISISDQGVGIPKSDLENIFDRFYRVDKARTRKTGGFGLGLSLARELADALDIHLEIESKEGIGTTIYLTLNVTESMYS